MEESLQVKTDRIDLDIVSDPYCEPCHEVRDQIKQVAGYCENCNENLCLECYNGHLRRKLFHSHSLVEKSTKPMTNMTPQTKHMDFNEECVQHHGETLQSFCNDHSQLCCQVCLTIDHQACKTEEITKLSRNIQDSDELENLIEKLNTLKKGFNSNLGKVGTIESVIQNSHRDAVNKMKKLREEFDKLMTEAESEAEKVKEEYFNKTEKEAATCTIVIEQINKLTTNLDTLKAQEETEGLFVSMKRSEGQLKSFERNLERIDKESMVTEYKFESDVRMKHLFNDLKVLGQLLFEKSRHARLSKHVKFTSLSDQKVKRPTHFKDIDVTSGDSSGLYGTLVLTNKQILVTDYNNMAVKLIDTTEDKVISELQVSDKPFAITKVKDNEVAVTIHGSPSKIQFISVFKDSLSTGRELSVEGLSRGITYNDKDQTLIVSYVVPGKVEILKMDGTVIKRLEKDSKGNKLFSNPKYVALSPDMTEMYITDSDKNTVTLMTMDGDIKAVYEDNSLQGPHGLYVHKSGLVYVVGYGSHTVHQLDPDSGKCKLLLKQKDGLERPLSISYCDLEDQMYIGMDRKSIIKVFKMK